MSKILLVQFYQAHRYFICGFVFVLVLGFYADIKELGAQLYYLWDQEKSFTQQLEEKQQAIQQAAPIINNLRKDRPTSPLLDQVIQAARLNECDISTIQLDSGNEESKNNVLQQNGLIFKLRLNTKFSNLYYFLATLSERSLPLMLNQFLIKINNDTLDISTQFIAYPQAFWTAEHHQDDFKPKRYNCCSRDPFADASLITKQEYLSADFLKKIALADLRYLGYLQQGLKISGLIALPNGAIYELSPAAVIGNEKWKVTNINASALTLIDAHQNKIMLSRRR